MTTVGDLNWGQLSGNEVTAKVLCDKSCELYRPHVCMPDREKERGGKTGERGRVEGEETWGERRRNRGRRSHGERGGGTGGGGDMGKEEEEWGAEEIWGKRRKGGMGEWGKGGDRSWEERTREEGETAGRELAGSVRRGAESQSRQELEEERVILLQSPGPSFPILLTPVHPF